MQKSQYDHDRVRHDSDAISKDEDGMIVALRQRDRVRRIHFRMLARNLQVVKICHEACKGSLGACIWNIRLLPRRLGSREPGIALIFARSAIR